MVISKVLVLEESNTSSDPLKNFCEEANLVGIRPSQGRTSDVMTILRSNVDLGGILLYEKFGGSAEQGLELARQIHATRPELPIFLRRDSIASVAGLSGRDAAIFRGAFTLNDLHQLRASLDASIFSRVYPNDLVRGITDISRTALQHLFRDCDISLETPYLVKDRFIYGEVFSMISIESHWCRGYMMLQAEEDTMLAMMQKALPGLDAGANFRELNNVLGEATNLIWGGFKNRFVTRDHHESGPATQVPILINHQRRYISFGSDDPQLCIKYTLALPGNEDVSPVAVHQRFVFNMSWSPDDFRENTSIDAFVSSGELELF